MGQLGENCPKRPGRDFARIHRANLLSCQLLALLEQVFPVIVSQLNHLPASTFKLRGAFVVGDLAGKQRHRIG